VKISPPSSYRFVSSPKKKNSKKKIKNTKKKINPQKKYKVAKRKLNLAACLDSNKKINK